MAHQAHNIPWNLLASNLRWSSAGSCPGAIHDLYPRFKPDQGKELTHFARAFADNVEEHSRCERKKYPEKYDPPESTDVIIGEKTAAKIVPILRSWKQSSGDCSSPQQDPFEIPFTCHVNCDCPPLPHHHRIASAFCRRQGAFDNWCCFYYAIGHPWGSWHHQVLQAMILYGEIDPILRACAHPEVAIGTWWEGTKCRSRCSTLGWDQIYRTALMAYICLNTIHCFPELWDNVSGKATKEDYRHSRIYQFMVRNLTSRWRSILVYPHRFFFGITEHQAELQPKNEFMVRREEWRPHFPWRRFDRGNPSLKLEGRYVYGTLPFDEFIDLEWHDDYLPGPFDVDIVRHVLCLKGLPVELALEIMAFADYTPKQRLKVLRDPFHPSNREELNQYLKYCWQLLVRCDVVAKEVGKKIDWEQAVARCMNTLWDDRGDWNDRGDLYDGREWDDRRSHFWGHGTPDKDDRRLMLKNAGKRMVRKTHCGGSNYTWEFA